MSYINQKYKHLFESNWSEALRTAKLLKSSYTRLTDAFPLSALVLDGANDDLTIKAVDWSKNQ